ncbi:MAG: hypothetical protein DME95_03670 [Verrucomicrobia bacterium]|nr:MAG: hypothetical protein DME95_03670 [Verrucomicrobiota bacterium]
MNVQAPFGFVTGCHIEDKFMVQASLASMRCYCPAVPICLVVDGAFDVSDLVKEYDVIPLRVADLSSPDMRKLIGGDYRAKLAAMWEGPFEHYVWLDSDAIIWGDFTAQIRMDVDFQVFWSEISIPLDATEIPTWLPHFYFDPMKLLRFDPDFEWRGHAYFSAGVFACRRNAIPFEVWDRTESWGRQSPGLFAWGEMGMLNYLVYAMAQRKELKIGVSDLQHVGAHHGIDELKQDCAHNNWHFPKTIRRPRIAHFCERKPFLFDRDSYSRPFTIARLEHHRRHKHELGAWLAIVREDFGVVRKKFTHRLRNMFSR